jgi:hypothetical protein
MNHPLDVVALFPSLLRALAGGCEVLSAAGLDVYLQENRWYWRWERRRVQSAHGFASLDAALVDALTYCVSPDTANTITAHSNN